MGLKFRRGSTAQQSGSLAFGEPYVNTTLGTLIVGGATGDIVLSTSGTGSTGNFGAISGSGLDITGNANIAGNVTVGGQLTIGDATADTVNVVASLSSSLIPQTTNAFDLGSATKIWRDLYISSGSIKMYDGSGALVSTITATSLNSNTSSVNALNSFSASQLTQNSTLATYTGSVDTRLTEIGVVSGSLISSASTAKTTNDVQDGRLTNLESTSASLNTSVTNLNTATSSYETKGRGIVSGSSQITYANISSIPAGIVSGSSQLSGTTITDLTIINLTTVNQTASVVFSSGSNKFGDELTDVQQFTGSVQVTGSLTTIGTSTATSFNGAINATNGIVSGSSQVIGILSSLNTYTGSNDTTNTTQNTRLTALEASASTALSTNNTQGTSITNLNSATASLLIETANLESFSSSALTRLSALETETSNLESFSSSALTRLSNLEGTDITITLTGDVTGTGTITNLGNVSFATTVAANQVALGTDTTGDYVASLVQGTGVTITNNSGESATPTIAIGQAVATSSDVRFNSIGVGMAASATAGRIDASNDVVAFSTSDIRFKENITAIPNAIEKIRKISGNTYDWKADLKDVHGYEGNDVGVIAQEIEEVLPQLVQNRDNGYKAVKYDKLVALLIEGIKEQQQHIDNLTIQVEELKKQKGL